MINDLSGGFRILDHSGDLKIVAWGRTPLEALDFAVRAMCGQIVALPAIAELEETPVIATAEDATDRMVAFLNEVLFLFHTRRWLPCRVKRLSECSQGGCRSLTGILAGEPFDGSRHEIVHDVKAVTYHDFSTQDVNGKTEIRFVCDL